MNFGFRYHLASLMAVFFSLILGILIGGALFPDNALVEEQGVLITELEERFREFHAREQVLQAELEYSNKAWSELRDVMVPQRLQARTVVLIEQAEQEGTSMLEQVLHLAGAEVKTLKGEDLAQVIPTDDLVFIIDRKSVV